MKRELAEGKAKVNGFTQKDMIVYILNKVDKIDEWLDSGSGKIAENRTNIKNLWKAVGAIGAALTLIFTKIFMR